MKGQLGFVIANVRAGKFVTIQAKGDLIPRALRMGEITQYRVEGAQKIVDLTSAGN